MWAQRSEPIDCQNGFQARSIIYFVASRCGLQNFRVRVDFNHHDISHLVLVEYFNVLANVALFYILILDHKVGVVQ